MIEEKIISFFENKDNSKNKINENNWSVLEYN